MAFSLYTKVDSPNIYEAEITQLLDINIIYVWVRAVNAAYAVCSDFSITTACYAMPKVVILYHHLKKIQSVTESHRLNL